MVMHHAIYRKVLIWHLICTIEILAQICHQMLMYHWVERISLSHIVYIIIEVQ